MNKNIKPKQMCTGCILFTFPIVVMTKTNDTGVVKIVLVFHYLRKYNIADNHVRYIYCRIFTVFAGVAVRILNLLTLFYMHIFHLHRKGQLSVIESIFKYNRNVLTVVQASSNVIQWI